VVSEESVYEAEQAPGVAPLILGLMVVPSASSRRVTGSVPGELQVAMEVLEPATHFPRVQLLLEQKK
jgi:hypothetical protein